MRAGQSPRPHRRGFTLIELVMTMSVIGVLAALSYPRMTSGYYSLKINGSARKLQSDIRYAQQKALDDHMKVDVVFDAAAERYRIADASTGVNLTDPYTRNAGVSGQDWSSGLYVDFVNDPELRGVDVVSATAATLRFSTFGHPTNTADTDLTANFDVILSYQGLTKTVRVTPTTGVVTVL